MGERHRREGNRGMVCVCVCGGGGGGVVKVLVYEEGRWEKEEEAGERERWGRS